MMLYGVSNPDADVRKLLNHLALEALFGVGGSVPDAEPFFSPCVRAIMSSLKFYLI